MNALEGCRALAREGLVKWSSGNVSERNGEAMWIKPSGVICGSIRQLASVRLSDGRHDPALKPSTDSDAHRYVYNHLPWVNGIVHTHSSFATAFAVAQRPIPCCMTMMADEFGGDVPISKACVIGDDDIGKEIVRLYELTGRPAMLIRQHGVFCLGKSVDAAVKAAVLCEEAAKVAHLAGRMGNIYTLTADEVERNHKRYQETYGQIPRPVRLAEV